MPHPPRTAAQRTADTLAMLDGHALDGWVDVVLSLAVDVTDAPADLADGYAGQSDWDPRATGEDYVFLVLRPERVQAWRESNEITGRTIMRDGGWVAR